MKRFITNEEGRVIDVDLYFDKKYKGYIMEVIPTKLENHNGYITKSYCPSDIYKVLIYQPVSGRQSKSALASAEHIMETIYRPYAEKVAGQNGLTIVE